MPLYFFKIIAYSLKSQTSFNGFSIFQLTFGKFQHFLVSFDFDGDSSLGKVLLRIVGSNHLSNHYNYSIELYLINFHYTLYVTYISNSDYIKRVHFTYIQKAFNCIIINSTHTINQYKLVSMILIDAVIFIIIIAGLHYYKVKSPNFLFFCTGAVLFLPPDDEEIANQKSQKSKTSSNDKSRHQISVLQVEYSHVKTYPFCNQYERVIMTIVALLILFIVRIPLKFVFPDVSLLPFYLISAITIYAVKIAVDVFMVSAYKSTVCFLIALGVNLVYFLLIFFMGNYQGIYDKTIQAQAADYAKYMEIVFGNNVINWINLYSVMGLVVIANFFITLAAIPSIVKFGNWYAKTLKQVYYEQDPTDTSTQKLLNTTAQSTKQASQKVKLNSKHVISLLNYYLVAVLIFSCLSHRICLDYVPQIVVDVLRIVFFMTSTVIILSTLKQAMEFNGSFAYKFVIQYFNEKSKEGRQMLKRKIVPYIYHIWYHLYQFVTRIIIPILLLCLVINWKYMSNQTDIESIHSFNRQFNSQVQCRVNVNQFQMFKNLYKCPIKSSRQMQEEKRLQTYSIVTGTLDGLPKELNPSQLQERVLKYGIIKRSFMVQFSEMLLWYANITIYSMTVIYVLFLRKTVYEI